MTDLDQVRRFPRTCDAETTRGGEAVPCEKPAVAARIDPDGHAYAVCVHHCRIGRMVPLAELLGVDQWLI